MAPRSRLQVPAVARRGEGRTGGQRRSWPSRRPAVSLLLRELGVCVHTLAVSLHNAPSPTIFDPAAPSALPARPAPTPGEGVEAPFAPAARCHATQHRLRATPLRTPEVSHTHCTATGFVARLRLTLTPPLGPRAEQCGAMRSLPPGQAHSAQGWRLCPTV